MNRLIPVSSTWVLDKPPYPIYDKLIDFLITF